jgi:hypothetical protein
MTGLALIAGIQKRPNLRAVLAEIGAFIDCRGDHRRDIAQLQVLRMAELLQRRRSLSPKSSAGQNDESVSLYK